MVRSRGSTTPSLVGEDEFDEIFGRTGARGLPYWADPHHREPGGSTTTMVDAACTSRIPTVTTSRSSPARTAAAPEPPRPGRSPVSPGAIREACGTKGRPKGSHQCRAVMTGATGFIGRNLLARLPGARRAGVRHRATGLGRSPACHRPPPRRRRSPHRPRRRGPGGAPPRGERRRPRADLTSRALLPRRRRLRPRRRHDGDRRGQRRWHAPHARAAAAAEVGCFHQLSSIAVAGRYEGTFTESMLDEAVGLDHPYFATKHESERLVRDACPVPWRVYRPSLVVGRSDNGEMDKVDGPYYFFSWLKRLATVPNPAPIAPAVRRAGQSRARRLRRRGDRSHRAPRGSRRPRVPHRRSRAADGRAGARPVLTCRGRPAFS